MPPPPVAIGPAPPPPPFSYGEELAHLPTNADIVRTVHEIGDDLVEYMHEMLLPMIKRFVKPLPDDEFLRVIRLKPLDLWAEHKAKFPGEPWPDSFQRQMERWVKLAPVDPLRDAILRELARMDMEQAAAAAMQAQPPSPWQQPGAVPM